jgi:SAM-dependent methyltransferase
MMYGSGERFDYFTCADCGCLQIADIPRDLGRHYPAQYYSLAPAAGPRMSWRRRWAARWEATRQGGLLGWLCATLKPNLEIRLLREIGIGPDDAILDVGCGRGDRVKMLAEAGFRRAEGIDAFLSGEVAVAGRVIARPGRIEDVSGSYRFVMFHHSLEHMPDQQAVLAHAKRLIGDNGRILVRLPTCSSFAWREYRENWVQLDAPRHLYLHSRDSLRRLAEQQGLRVERMRDDSGSFQFWGSEQYRRGIALIDPRGHGKGHPLFDDAQMKAFARRAEALNRKGEGDQVSVVLAPC